MSLVLVLCPYRPCLWFLGFRWFLFSWCESYLSAVPAFLICFSVDLHPKNYKLPSSRVQCWSLVLLSSLWHEFHQCLRTSYHLHAAIAIRCWFMLHPLIPNWSSFLIMVVYQSHCICQSQWVLLPPLMGKYRPFDECPDYRKSLLGVFLSHHYRDIFSFHLFFRVDLSYPPLGLDLSFGTFSLLLLALVWFCAFTSFLCSPFYIYLRLLSVIGSGDQPFFPAFSHFAAPVEGIHH